MSLLSASSPGAQARSTRPCNPILTPNGNIEGIGFMIPAPDVGDYIIAYDWPIGGKISQLRIGCATGRGICSIKINNVVATGIASVPLDYRARAQHGATDKNTFKVGDDIVFSLESAEAGLTGVKATLVISDRTLPRNFTLDETLQPQGQIYLRNITRATGGLDTDLDAMPTKGLFSLHDLIITREGGLAFYTYDSGAADPDDGGHVAVPDYHATLNNYHWTKRE